MPFDIRWYVPDRVLIVDVGESITIEELLSIRAEVDAIMVTISDDHPTKWHVIIDGSQLDRMPASLEAFRQQLVKPHPATGWICMVSTNKLQNMIMTTLMQLMRLNHKTFVTLDEAVAFLTSLEPDLADLILKDEHENKS